MSNKKGKVDFAGDILIIDDTPDNLKLLFNILSNAGYQVRPALNGELGLKAVKGKVPDLILLDIRIPKMSGFEVCRRLKASKHTCDIPIIFVSGINDVADKNEGFRLGAVDYITKPFESSEVLSRIKTHLTIRTTREELKRLNAELEERVSQRTEDLVNTNEELRKSETKFRSLVESSSDCIWEMDLKGVYIYISPQIKTALGYTPEDVIGMSMFDLVLPEEIKKIKKTFKKIEEKGAPIVTLENVCLHKNGQHIVFETRGVPIYNKEGKIIGYRGVSRDITERKKAEESLHKFEYMVSNSNDMMALLDKNYIYLAANPAYMKSFGKKYNEIIGHSVSDIYGIDIFKKIIKPHADHCLNLGKKIHYQNWFDFPVAGRQYMNIAYFPYDKPFGNITGFVVTARDITKFKKLQEQLVQSEKLAALGQLSAGVAHEFNNMLSIIKGNTQLGLISSPSEELKTILNTINNVVDSSDKIVRDMSFFSRPKQPDLKIGKIDRVIDEILNLQKKQIKFENIKVVKKNNSSSKVMYDWGQMEQVFGNLFINARHAIKPKKQGIIIITIKDDDGYVQIRFSDSGTGMNEETRKRVFEPFFTTKSAYSKNRLDINGTGLGLSVSHSIIKQHKGMIWVESKEKQGTTFIINLPIYVGKKKQEHAEPVKKAASVKTTGSLKILLIDDEKLVINVFKKLLTIKGYNDIKVQTSGKQALKLISTYKPDVVFLDMIMPNMTGEEILQKIKSLYFKTHVIFLSGKLWTDKNKFKKIGAYDYIKKPFDIDQVLSILAKIENEKLNKKR